MGELLILAFGIAVIVLLVKIAGRGQPRKVRGTDLLLCFNCNRPRRADTYSCPHCSATKPDPHAGQKKCVACAEWILREAAKCRHCGEPQAAPAASPIAPHFVAPDGAVPGMGYCAGCGKLRHFTVAKCVYCSDMAPVVAERPAPPPTAPTAETINWEQVDRADRNRGRP